MRPGGKLELSWINAGLPNANSRRVAPAPAENFQRLYSLTSFEYGLDNIVFSHMKLSRFSDLNDPYEMFSTSNQGDVDRKASQKYKDDFNDRSGILCFSSDWKDPVLWSHYASKHQGLALGFDVKTDIVTDIEYTTKRIGLKKGLSDGEKDQILLKTKFESWSYEREKRVLVPLEAAMKKGNMYFVDFDEEIVLKEVIFGALCNKDHKIMRKIVDSIYDDVSVFKARLADRSFNVIARFASASF
jgi:hypothetical protein